MPIMPKRKAQATGHNTIQEEDETHGALTETTYSQSHNRIRETQMNEPLAATEKRKRFSTALKDNDLSHLNDVEIDAENGSFSESQLTHTQEKSKGPCSGVIERVYLKNFKCHNMLEFNLHPYINFILGRNGSGKSAVMDAIILCLGGRANNTGRSASAKTFIKTNTDKAELSVTIRNVGEDAYKPKEYGSKIIIERKIPREGAATYRILNDKMKVVSTKKQEVDNIVEQFNIQVDNPVCFLNQETSKHFLNTSNKSEKYKFFMKASQLESMKKTQEQVEAVRLNSVTLLKDKQSQLPSMQDKLYEWEEKYKKCQSVEKLRKKQSVLMHEYTWAVVINCERLLETECKNRSSLLKSQEKLEKKLQESETNLEITNQDFKKAKEGIATLSEKAKTVKVEHENATEVFKRVQQKYKTVLTETKKLNMLHEKKSKESDSIRKKLEEDKHLVENDYEEERRQKEEKIKSIDLKMREKNQQEKSLMQELADQNKTVEDLQKQNDEKRFELRNVERSIQSLQKDIDTLSRSSEDQIIRFGDFMPNLMNDINIYAQQGKFKEKPRGPIGMFIESRDERYSLAIEQCLASLINNFICGNYDDEKVLQQLFNRHIRESRFKPRIIVTSFNNTLHDANRFKPRNIQYPTIYDMLTIKDHIVANVLMDQRRIETILLLPDYSTARNMIEFNSTANCYEAFIPSGDQFIGKPSYRTYACQSKTTKHLYNSPEALIQIKQAKIEEFHQDIPILRQSIAALAEELQRCKQLKEDSDRQANKLKREYFSLKNQLDEAKNIPIPEPVNLAVYEDELERLESEMNSLIKQVETIETNSGASKSEYENANNEKQIKDREFQELQATIDEFKGSFDKIDNERSELQEAVKHYRKLLDEALVKVNKSQDSIRDQETELENITKAALELSDRIDTRKTTKAIDIEVQNIDKQIQQTEKLHGNEEEITRNYMEKRDIYKKTTTDIKKNHNFLKRLEEALATRETKLANFTKSKGLRCAMDFNTYLRNRDYDGSMTLDHEAQTLDITVHPNKNKNAHEDRDLKSLSGGERSFSTVAFLLSLWSIVESPILFLDEFDVFMDQINRRIVMELILSSAKEKLNGQYMFLTPQEMGYIKPDEHVKLYKMPDPKRSIDQVGNRENEENIDE